MPRYTDRYSALEAGRRTTMRKSRSSGDSSPKVLIYVTLLLVVLLLAVVAVVVVRSGDSVGIQASRLLVQSEQAEKCGWDTCNFYQGKVRVAGLTDKAVWSPTLNGADLETIGKKKLFDRLLDYRAARVPLTANIVANKGAAAEAALGKTGLKVGHEYSVLDAQNLKTKTGKVVQLVQLRNPHGSGEWRGAWNNGASEWTNNPDVKRYLDQPSFVQRGNGVFWMPYDEFAQHFSKVTALGRSMPELAARSARKPQEAFYIRAH